MAASVFGLLTVSVLVLSGALAGPAKGHGRQPHRVAPRTHGGPQHHLGPRPVIPKPEMTMVEREAAIMSELMHLTNNNETLARAMNRAFQFDAPQTRNVFPCPTLAKSDQVPTSVHRLRPGDINVVAALGDSLTAGRGAKGGVFGLLIDYRGVSWSAGGDDNYESVVTLPNILRKYNPGVYGYAEDAGDIKSGFNVAVTGAKSNKVLQQAEDVVHKMYNDGRVNWENDWKLITVFIGANDLCDWCVDEAKYSAENYKANLEATLDYLHTFVPRAFVNLVMVLNVEMAEELAKGFVCGAVHAYACDCASNPRNEEAVKKLIALREGYQEVTRQLAYSGKYDTREDFTVVLQPFYQESDVPMKNSEIDYSYFGADCFHYSKKGQGVTAEALWNNMVEPVGTKRLSWTPDEAIECPTEDSPYFFTNLNS